MRRARITPCRPVVGWTRGTKGTRLRGVVSLHGEELVSVSGSARGIRRGFVLARLGVGVFWFGQGRLWGGGQVRVGADGAADEAAGTSRGAVALPLKAGGAARSRVRPRRWCGCDRLAAEQGTRAAILAFFLRFGGGVGLEPGRLFWQRCGPAWAQHPCGVLLGRAESVSACLTCICPLRVWHVLLRPSSCRWFRPHQVCAHTDMPSMYTHVVRAGVRGVTHWGIRLGRRVGDSDTDWADAEVTFDISGDGDDDLLHGEGDLIIRR